MIKDFVTQQNIGHARYTVSFCDGIKTHDDGSRFYDLRIFPNKKDEQTFIKELKKDGYDIKS